jgi:hypothetical protein
MAIVYIHKGLDNDEIFYVGIGNSEKRAGSKEKRSKFWRDYVAIHGFTYEILYSDITWEDACKNEIELIKFYGRRDLKNGILVNMTDGGAGGSTMKGKKNPKIAELNRSRTGKPGIKLRWINRDFKNKRVTEDKLEEFIRNGWNLGALKNGPRESTRGIPTWNKGKFGYKNPKIGEALRGKKRETYKKREILTCPHCGKISDSTAIKRWHLEKCKNKK